MNLGTSETYKCHKRNKVPWQPPPENRTKIQVGSKHKPWVMSKYLVLAGLAAFFRILRAIYGTSILLPTTELPNNLRGELPLVV